MSPTHAIHSMGSKKLPGQRSANHRSETAPSITTYSDASREKHQHQHPQTQPKPLQEQQQQLQDYLVGNRSCKPTTTPIECWLKEDIREQPWTDLRVPGRNLPQSGAWIEELSLEVVELDDLTLNLDLEEQLPLSTLTVSILGSESTPCG
ncbi:hypothetical protein NEUTE1DRAFT_114328 [Neurospora tetrasperma FGSC 2508]|uniref:Uncharacterized protein n=1 Tax=Neurospora tetrasperma (strain FGSC 2508 / ATCC MYA-4615 / P0657) TaxID=510951 RepID=F8N1S9_NEUT8|nr:uncharacterized protein NEUTE1DRAFT_114328 [Neurospora tetrasperma FGSC 2508]EGO52356.1 hypothetical protein NEUTE1DRAFT_114328 [Neurospora tetrasperma FGSC 2508]